MSRSTREGERSKGKETDMFYYSINLPFISPLGFTITPALSRREREREREREKRRKMGRYEKI